AELPTAAVAGSPQQWGKWQKKPGYASIWSESL
ncbi:unnamed protein product, partial [marine sediment metagenome]